MEILKKHLKNISSDREIALKAVAKAIYQDVKSSGKAQVIFICTHNSRRSQLAELMLSHLLRLNNISHIYCYSGGTEATAFNHRMVKAVIDFGIPLLKYGPDSNPLYIANDTQYLFSKKYDGDYNPAQQIIAITTCNDADEKCPIIHGADHRFHVAYKDPKHADDQANEAAVYANKVLEIGSEMYRLVEYIKELNLN